MASDELTRKFQDHGDRAVHCFYAGKRRESADEYYKAFQNSPSLEHNMRYQIYHGWTSLFNESFVKPTEQDFENMKKVMNDKQELRLYRVDAGFTLGLLYHDQLDRQEAAEMYHEAIRIGEKKLKKHEIKTENKKVFFNGEFVTMKSLVEQSLTNVRDNLNIMSSHSFGSALSSSLFKNSQKPPEPRMRADGTLEPTIIRNFRAGGIFRANMRDKNDFNRLINIGGSECDCCGKKEKDIEGNLSKCAACNRGFYCGKDCQLKSWKTYGHKQYCRKPGEVKAGDYVILHGLQSRQDLNDIIAKVIAPVTSSTGRWQVKIHSNSEAGLSISEKNMKPLRPLDCLRREI